MRARVCVFCTHVWRNAIMASGIGNAFIRLSNFSYSLFLRPLKFRSVQNALSSNAVIARTLVQTTLSVHTGCFRIIAMDQRVRQRDGLFFFIGERLEILLYNLLRANLNILSLSLYLSGITRFDYTLSQCDGDNQWLDTEINL